MPKITREEMETLRKSALLEGLSESAIEAILEPTSVRQVSDGAFFFNEQEPAEQAFILLKGKVKLIQLNEVGQQVILGYLVPGRVYGIIGAIKKISYPVSAQAVGESKALVWSQEILGGQMARFPEMTMNAMRIMASQIQEFQGTINDLSTKRVEQRIARAVLRLARQSGRQIADGVVIDLPLTRQDLAEMTGTTLYTVSRVLNEWEQRGLIKSKRQQVTLLSAAGLGKIAEDLPESAE